MMTDLAHMQYKLQQDDHNHYHQPVYEHYQCLQ